LVNVEKIELQNQTCLLSSTRDITKLIQQDRYQKEIEKKMQTAQKLESLGILAGGIAHDFNNLLAGILGNADLASYEVDKSHPVSEYIHEIKMAAKRATKLTNQMLAYSGRAKIDKSNIDLSQLVKEMLSLLKQTLEKGVILKLDLHDPLSTFMGDEGQIQQIVMNLITNASDAIGKKQGVIKISISEISCDISFLNEFSFVFNQTPGKFILLEVSDSGEGMTPEILTQIFEPFFTTKVTGRGLGLSAVIGIVKRHQGCIDVNSKEQEGTQFRILFPSTEKPLKSNTTEENIKEQSPFIGKTALLIDDEDYIRQLGSKMLQNLGFQVENASNGQQGLDMINQSNFSYDLVMLDLTMPQMDGNQLLEILLETYPNRNYLVSSGYSQQDIADKIEKYPNVHFIQKPFQIKTLREVLQYFSLELN
ncbi:MAG: hybrid sensor histidine kinase/response regulator, partial [Promethearchaeota archaeon]